tara:strand:+ start:236 stop:526 length:291 start_codon:yes stop_codon:yes gene_type:complete
MYFSKFCTPALIYLVFIIVHVIIELKEYDKRGALLQLLLGIIVALLLQFLCMKGMTVISWIIVLIPFIFYTYMVVILYNVFGIDPSKKVQKFIVHS